MNTIHICRGDDMHLHIEVNISGSQFVFLRYGSASELLSDYLPIKVLPLDQDGYGKYKFSPENMIPEAATHIWAAPRMHFTISPLP